MFGLSPMELVIVAVVAILMFGKNLPQVLGKAGKYYRDFRRTLGELQSQVDFTGELDSTAPAAKPRKTYREYDDHDEVSAPKFEPPPAPPEVVE